MSFTITTSTQKMSSLFIAMNGKAAITPLPKETKNHARNASLVTITSQKETKTTNLKSTIIELKETKVVPTAVTSSARCTVSRIKAASVGTTLSFRLPI